jgi:hypothetical protein
MEEKAINKKEKYIDILKDIPEEIITAAYSLNLGSNEMYAQMEFNSEILQLLNPNVAVDANGYIEFHIQAAGKRFRITMT